MFEIRLNMFSFFLTRELANTLTACFTMSRIILMRMCVNIQV